MKSINHLKSNGDAKEEVHLFKHDGDELLKVYNIIMPPCTGEYVIIDSLRYIVHSIIIDPVFIITTVNLNSS